MKATFTLSILCLSIFTVGLAQQAQGQATLPEQSRKTGLSKIGATFGIGAANLNLKDINNRLQELEIGQLEASLTTLNLSMYSEIHGGLGASFSVGTGVSFDSFTSDPKAFLNLKMLTIGVSLHYALLSTNRIRIHVLGGPRFNDMRLTYNTNTSASPDLNGLFTNPSANSNSIVLESVPNGEAAVAGASFQYRTGRKENVKQREYTVGIDTGYNFNFGDTPWREVHSKAIVQNMPVIRPDHFYLNFTFSAFLLR